MNIHVYPAEQQGADAFDGGRFIEQRPINFPGEQGAVKRVGPLFYWAWGKSIEDAEIGMHPHKAFEVMTYVISGTVEHRDSLGSRQTVTAGGAQVMQAGSGIDHGEAFRGSGTEGLQIWFEPNIRQTLNQPPTYHQYEHEQFPNVLQHGVTFKTVIGPGAPIQIETDAKVFDITLEPDSTYIYPLPAGRQLAFLVIRGNGTGQSDGNTAAALSHKDFVVVQAEAEETLELKGGALQGMRITAIEVPVETPYPLYRK